MKQTVTNRYKIGEPVALSDTTLLMYQGYDQALKRDVWVEIYQISSDKDKSEKQLIYDCIREQVLLMNDWLRNVFDVYDDDGNVYVVGESLRNYVPLSAFLQQPKVDQGKLLTDMLFALSKVIEFSLKCQHPFSITADRILLCNKSIKLIPKYQMQKQLVDNSRHQAFDILLQIYQKVHFPAVYQDMISSWLQHAEKHGKIIDDVDLQIWLEELNRVQLSENPPLEHNVSDQMDLSQHTVPVPDAKQDKFANAVRANKIFSRKPATVWMAIAVISLIVLGFVGYNWLNPTIAVPDLRGKSYSDAVKTLHNLGIDETKIERVDSYTSAQKPGFIYAQDPIPDSKIRLSSVVVLRVSKGLAAVTLPNVIGLSGQQAKDMLIQAGISPDQLTIRGDATASNTVVVSEQPEAGKAVDTSGTVTLVLSANGSSSGVLTMPNLTGLSLQQATDILLKSGIHYKYKVQQSSATSGTVFDQSVKPGEQVDRGSYVSFSVAR